MVKGNECVTVNMKTNKEKVRCNKRGYPFLKQDTTQRRQDKGHLLAVKERLLSLGAESFVFQVATQTFKDQNI